MKSIPYKSAVIGLGNIAWKYDQAVMVKNGVLTHAEAYKLHSDTVLVGGCSPDEKDRNGFAEKYNVPVFSSVDELLQDTLPDIVSICSPAYLHFEHTCKCIASGVRMIWLEKPPALTKEEIDFIIKEQDREKVVVLVNYQRRYCQGYIRLKEIFCNKTLGEVKFVYMTYSRGLSANGSHIIDILHYILGDKVRITLASSLTSGCKGEPSFVLRTDEGLLVFVMGISLPYHCLDISLTCDKGRTSVLYGGMKTTFEEKTEHEFYPGFYRLKERNGNVSDSCDMEKTMLFALDDLVESYRQGKSPRSNLETARGTVAVIEEIERVLGAGL